MTTALEAGQLPWWLHVFLGAELLADRQVRLEQAGSRSEQRVALAGVFVDLEAGPPRERAAGHAQAGRLQPLTREMQVAMRWRPAPALEGDGHDGGDQLESLPPGLLASLAKVPVVPGGEGHPGDEVPPRWLLLTGGPGWGKSTLGQMLCQVHRAGLLSGQQLPPTVLRTLQSTAETARTQKFFPEVTRLPMRVVLTDFAAWLAETKADEGAAVFRYLAARIAKRLSRPTAEQEALAEEIAHIFGAFPSLFVFDGLDEVAETAGRPEVIQAIVAFLKALESSPAPPVVLLTSRPSAALRDLRGFVEWRIRPLSKARALRQAAHLVAHRYPTDSHRQEEMASRLGEAWQSETTRALFQVPLHVALTVVLVDAIGRLPEERWRLFDEHYRVLYQRELEKPTQAAAILREHRPLIDAVHQRAALLLQVESEQAGGSRSVLSRERLSEIIRAVLEEEIDEPERSTLLNGILDAATERLVLLARVEESPDRYGFEVRSLQELFAAEALFVGREAHFIERLSQIAFAPAFRNVVLFAASKLDAKSELWHLREDLVALCSSPSNKSSESPLRRSRAELALDLLEDGFPRRSKRLAEDLFTAALDLLDMPPHPQLLRMTWAVSGLAEPLLRSRIERMAAEEGAASMTFWLVLAELADNGFDWAARIGDEHWPADPSGRRSIVRTAVRNWERLGPWLGRKLGASPQDFPPWTIEDLLRGGVHVEIAEGDLPAWLEDCLLFLTPGFVHWNPSRLAVPVTLPELPQLALTLIRSTRRSSAEKATGDRAAATSFEGVAESAVEPPAERDTSGSAGSSPLQEIPDVWRPFALAVAFCADPAPEHLSHALNTLASVRDADAVRWAEPHMSWVLRMCLRQARSMSPAAEVTDGEKTSEELRVEPQALWAQSVGLRTLAEKLIKTPTLFGTSEEWACAEQAWSRGIGLGQIGPTAWPPVAWDGSWFPADVAELESERLWDYRPPEIATFLQRHLPREQWRSSRLRARLWLSLLLTAAHFPDPFPVTIEPPELTAILEVSEQRVFRFMSVLPLRIETSTNDAWPTELDRIGRRVMLEPVMGGATPALSGYLAERWAERPERTGLLRWLAEMVNLGWQPRWGLVTLPVEHPDLQVRLDTWAIFLAAGFPVEEAYSAALAFAADLPVEAPDSFPWFGVPFGLRRRCSPAARRNFAVQLLQQLPPQLARWPWREMGFSLLHQEQEHRAPTGLEDRGTWVRLDLPLPLPWRPPSTPPPFAATSRIESIVLHNIRVFQDLDLPVVKTPNAGSGGQWIVLLGENAVGKSTVLRAAALALLDPTLSAAIVKESPAGYLAHEARDGRIEVHMGAHVLRVALRQEADGTVGFGVVGDAPRPPVFAYGCRRGSALGGAARAVSFTPSEAVATLFDEGASLIHAETWLKGRAFAAGENSREKVVFDEVKKALLRAMPGIQSIDVKPDGVWLYGPAVGRTRLAGLSDGYLTMMGWIIDLIARWTEREERRKSVIEPGFLELMEGVVLLDELDLHLHPRWQVQVIDDLRALFPRMTFVVTTHNPLTLLGARKGEVIVLRRPDEAADVASGEHPSIVARQQDLRPGLTVDEILTGAWFGLSTTLDEDTLARLEEHRLLVRQGRTEDDPERLALEAELRRRLGRFADTSLERLAQTVAASLSPTSIRDLSPEEREELAKKVRETVAAERAAAGARPPEVRGS